MVKQILAGRIKGKSDIIRILFLTIQAEFTSEDLFWRHAFSPGKKLYFDQNLGQRN